MHFVAERPSRVAEAAIKPGRQLTTKGTTSEETKLFTISLDGLGFVAGVSALSKASQQDVGNYACLFGLHEKFLNNLASRFDEGLIADFFAFFRESWATAIFHDRFAGFVDDLREAVRTAPVRLLHEKLGCMLMLFFFFFAERGLGCAERERGEAGVGRGFAGGGGSARDAADDDEACARQADDVSRLQRVPPAELCEVMFCVLSSTKESPNELKTCELKTCESRENPAFSKKAVLRENFQLHV